MCVYINARKAGKNKALSGLDTIVDSDQFKRQGVHSVQKWLIPLWLRSERKICHFVPMFGFSLKIRPVTNSSDLPGWKMIFRISAEQDNFCFFSLPLGP